MPTSAFVVVGGVRRLHVLMALLSLALIFQSLSAQSSPHATPTTESPSAPVGTIGLAGWDGVTAVSFAVTDASGSVLETGVIASAYYESEFLVTEPGSNAVLTLFANPIFAESSVMSTGMQDGSLHFDATLLPKSALDSSLESFSESDINSQEPVDQRVLKNSGDTGIVHTLLLKSSRSQVPLPGHLVTIWMDNGQSVTARSDASGVATFTLLPGSYNVQVDPYGAHAGAKFTMNVSQEVDSTSVTLTRVDSSGTLVVSISPYRDDLPMVRVLNGDGVMIAIVPLNASPLNIPDIAYGSGYTIQIDGSRNFQQSISETFDFRSNLQTISVPTRVRSWVNAYIFLTSSEPSELPEQIEVSLSIQDWSGTGVAVNTGTGSLGGSIEVPAGSVSYSIHAAGYKPVSGVALLTTSNGRLAVVLEPAPAEIPTPTPTVVPSPTPTVVPSPTPTVVPSPTPTVVPSPTPTVVPSPTPTVIPSPTPTVVPSPTPTVIPSPTPTVAPSPTPTVVPSPTPMIVTSPAPTLEPTSTAIDEREAPPADSPDVDNVITTVITLETADNQDLTGAPFDLYAPLASQVAMQPYFSGFVGPGNRIELINLPSARYRLVLRPENMEAVDLTIEVGSINAEVVVTVKPRVVGNENSASDVTGNGNPPTSDVESRSPIQNAENNAILVTELPSTGATGAPGQWFWFAIIVPTFFAAAVVLRPKLNAHRKH